MSDVNVVSARRAKWCPVVLGLLFASLAPSAFALDVSGVNVEERVRVANQDLVLNGAGIRYAAAGLVRVYVAQLYLPLKRNTSAEIGALKGPKRVTLALLRDINANELSKGLLGGMRANLSAAEQQKHFDSLLKLGAIFGMIPSLKKGNTISVDLVPGTGMIVNVNGKRVGDVFQDESFFQALLQIWLGPKPIDESLKPVLLGTVPSNDNSVSNVRDRY